MNYLDDDPIGKHNKIHLQTSYESYEVCRLMVTNGSSYDSDLLTKDTDDIRGLLIVCDHTKQRKTEMTNQ